jgi:hypothetical protein
MLIWLLVVVGVVIGIGCLEKKKRKLVLGTAIFLLGRGGWSVADGG